MINYSDPKNKEIDEICATHSTLQIICYTRILELQKKN